MTSVAICLVAALVAGVSVQHGLRPATAPRATHATPVILRTSPHPSPAHRAVIGAPVAQLTSAVRRVMSKQEGAAARIDYGTVATGRPIVHLTRASRNRAWAFGTTVIPVPAGSAAPPWTALFLAHAIGGRWRIALSGTAGFGQMLASASRAVLPAAEKPLLARFNAAQAAPAPASGAPPVGAAPAGGSAPAGGTATPGGAPTLGGAPRPGGTPTLGGAPRPGGTATPGDTATQGAVAFALPWRAGQLWRFTAAFSGSGTSQAGTMFSFSGGDGRVLAAGPGRLYRFCGGVGTDALIEVIHPDGSATEYYQLSAETRAADGSLVATGTYLGMTGTSLACGGTVPGPGQGLGQEPGQGAGKRKKASGPLPGTVSFAVITGGSVANLGRLTLGGWTFHQQVTPPLVWAQRAAVRVTLGGLLENVGAAAPVAAPGPTAAPSPTPSPDPSPSSSPGKSASKPPAALGLPGVAVPGVAVRGVAVPVTDPG